MKIANSEIIRKREQELIGAVAANLDWEAIRKVLKEKHGLMVGDEVKCRRAGIDAKGNKILYSIDFDVMIRLTIQLDRDGELMGVKSSHSEDSGMESLEKEADQESPPREVSTADIEMEDSKESGVIEEFLEKNAELHFQEEAAHETEDEAEGGYEDILMEFGSDSSNKSE